ncbi:hypothetical protein HPB48_004447 [Haemaphysalis longicornis]|uniref:Endonuclease-reverse transcriptase n=1 Tax=Haemaphysalis longicornis TaxID=44386 RepID=A0A9J6FXH1_HAELO|nr:hypothetical protein HPB48_004447 [Haemaphysalis longicornis]
MAELAKRITNLQTQYEGVTVRKDVETNNGNTAEIARQVYNVVTRVDGAENRPRKNNLTFYGLSDAKPSEKISDSQDIVINHCRDNLGLTLDPKQIERIHRLGRHRNDHQRPIIAKFTFFKIKEKIPSNGRKLKGGNFSIVRYFLIHSQSSETLFRICPYQITTLLSVVEAFVSC